MWAWWWTNLSCLTLIYYLQCTAFTSDLSTFATTSTWWHGRWTARLTATALLAVPILWRVWLLSIRWSLCCKQRGNLALWNDEYWLLHCHTCTYCWTIQVSILTIGRKRLVIHWKRVLSYHLLQHLLLTKVTKVRKFWNLSLVTS